MHVVVMPKLGLTMQEAELVRWLADVGGTVRAGQPLCEVETDKITMEVESPADGVLLRRVEAGEVVAVGTGIAVVGDAAEDVSGVTLHGAPPSPNENRSETHFDSGDPREPRGDAKVTPVTAESVVNRRAVAAAGTEPGGRRSVSPVARRLADELGVDLAAVPGTGPGGRIVRRDVETAAGVAPTGDDAG